MDTHFEHDVFDAAWRGDLERIKRAIEEEGFDINWQYHYKNGVFSPPRTVKMDVWMIHTGDLNGSTLLHIACFRGHLSLVKYLLCRGANTDLRNAFGRKPEHMMTTQLSTCSPKDRLDITGLLQTH